MKQLIAIFLLFLLLCPAAYAAQAEKKPVQPQDFQEDDWVTIPAGGKPAYMGIHGGTMPVSLLVSGDGSSLFSFVGVTGNDFLEALRNSFVPLPSFGNSTNEAVAPITSIAPPLFAGNATASLPVISPDARTWANKSLLSHLEYFGLSVKPLRIEGQVSPPEKISPARKFRHIFLPGYFQPQRP